MEREPPVPCANQLKSWFPATHARNPKTLWKDSESESVIQAPSNRPIETPSGGCSRPS